MDRTQIQNMPIEFIGTGMKDGRVHCGGICTFLDFTDPAVYIIEAGHEAFEGQDLKVQFHAIRVIPESVGQWTGEVNSDGGKIYRPVISMMGIRHIQFNVTIEEKRP